MCTYAGLTIRACARMRVCTFLTNRERVHVREEVGGCFLLSFYFELFGPGLAPPLPFMRLSFFVPVDGLFLESSFPRPSVIVVFPPLHDRPETRMSARFDPRIVILPCESKPGEGHDPLVIYLVNERSLPVHVPALTKAITRNTTARERQGRGGASKRRTAARIRTRSSS